MTGKYIALAILAALLCTSYITTEVIFNGITNAKSVWFLFVSGIAMLYLAAVFKNNASNRFNSLDIAVGMFLIYLVANNTFHDGQLLSRKNVENAGLLVTYFFTKRLFFGSRPPYHQYIILLLLLILSQMAIAVLQWFEYLPSYNSNFLITGIFFNPGPFIIFLSTLLIYGFSSGLYSTNKIIKIISVVLFIVAIPIILITLSRSAWLGLIAGMVLIVIIHFQLFKKAEKWFKATFMKAIGAIVLLVIIAFWGFYLYHLKRDSADGRKLIWKISSHMIADHPFIGIGQDRFPARFIEYQSAYFKQHPEKMFSEGRLSDTVYYTFNDILQITVEQGIIGLILFATVLSTGLKLSRKLIKNGTLSKVDKSDGVIIGAIACIVVILISGFTSYPLVILPILILFYSSIGIISAAYTNTNPVATVNKPVKIVVLSGTILIGGFGLIFYSLALGQAYYLENYIVGHSYDKDTHAISKLTRYKLLVNTEEWYLMRQCDYLLNKDQYKTAIIALENAKEFTANKAVYFSLADLYLYQKQYAEAEAQLKLMYYALPALVAPKYRLAKFYYDTQQKDKWNAAAAEVLDFKPKITSPRADEMIDEIRQLKYNY